MSAPSFWLEARHGTRSSLRPLTELCPECPATLSLDTFWGVLKSCNLHEVRDRFDMTLHFFAPGFRPSWEAMPRGAVAKVYPATISPTPFDFDLLWPVACALLLSWHSESAEHESDLASCAIVGVSAGHDLIKFWLSDVTSSADTRCTSCRNHWPVEHQMSSIDAFKTRLVESFRSAATVAYPDVAVVPPLGVSLQSNAVALRKAQRTDSRTGSGHVHTRSGSNLHHRNISFGDSTTSVEWMSARGQALAPSIMASPHGRTRSDPFSTSLTGPMPRHLGGADSSSPIVSIRVNNPYAVTPPLSSVSPPLQAFPPPQMGMIPPPLDARNTPTLSVRVGNNLVVGTSPIANFQPPPVGPIPALSAHQRSTSNMALQGAPSESGESRSNSVAVENTTPTPTASASTTPSARKGKTRRGRRAGQKVRDRESLAAVASMFKDGEASDDDGETPPPSQEATQKRTAHAAATGANESDDDNSVVVSRLSPTRLDDVMLGHSIDAHVAPVATGGSFALGSLTSPALRSDSIQFLETPRTQRQDRRSHGRTVSFEVPTVTQVHVNSVHVAPQPIPPPQQHRRRLSDMTTPVAEQASEAYAATRKLGSTKGWLELLSLDDDFYTDL